MTKIKGTFKAPSLSHRNTKIIEVDYPFPGMGFDGEAEELVDLYLKMGGYMAMVQKTIETMPQKHRNQRRKILDLLRKYPCVPMTVLNKIAFRYSARIHELRKMGFTIKTTKGSDGLSYYSLEGEPRDDVLHTVSPQSGLAGPEQILFI